MKSELKSEWGLGGDMERMRESDLGLGLRFSIVESFAGSMDWCVCLQTSEVGVT